MSVDLTRRDEIGNRLWKLERASGDDGLTLILKNGRWVAFFGTAVSEDLERFCAVFAPGSQELAATLAGPIHNLAEMTEEMWSSLSVFAPVLADRQLTAALDLDAEDDLVDELASVDA